MRFEELSSELKKKIGACATVDDLKSLLESEGIEPTAKMLASVLGGGKDKDKRSKPEAGGFGGTTGGAF